MQTWVNHNNPMVYQPYTLYYIGTWIIIIQTQYAHTNLGSYYFFGIMSRRRPAAFAAKNTFSNRISL